MSLHMRPALLLNRHVNKNTNASMFNCLIVKSIVTHKQEDVNSPIARRKNCLIVLMCYTGVAGLVQRKPAPQHTRRDSIMGRPANPPKGFYTAGQAVKKLHMSRSSLYNLVEKGRIRKITPPSKTDG